VNKENGQSANLVRGGFSKVRKKGKNNWETGGTGSDPHRNMKKKRAKKRGKGGGRVPRTQNGTSFVMSRQRNENVSPNHHKNETPLQGGDWEKNAREEGIKNFSGPKST